MGAETKVYVKVEKIEKMVVEWIELSAITLDQAIIEAKKLPKVHRIIYAQYDKPNEEK